MLVSRWRRPLGLSPTRMAGFLRPAPRGLQSVPVELDRASSERATTASGQVQRLTKSDSDKGAAIIPIDAQLLGTNGFGRASGRYDRGLPTLLHWPDPQRAAGAAAPLKRV